MAKTGYSTWWVPKEYAEMKTCLAQHQRVFAGNQLAVADGYVKVAVLDKETPPEKSISYRDFLALRHDA